MASEWDKPPKIEPLSPAAARSRRSRNIAIALTVAGVCVLFYVVTIVKLGPAVLMRPL